MDLGYFNNSPWKDRLQQWLDGHSHERSFLDANVAAIQRYMKEPATGLRMVVNIPADALISFCGEGIYRNAYTLPVVAGKDKRPSASRVKVDQLLELRPPEDFFFGAVSIGGAGVRFYGEYCMVLKPEAVPDETRVFDRNSYDLLHAPLATQPVPMKNSYPQMLRGEWARDAVHMLLMKVLPEIRSSVRLLTVGTAADAVLHDEDFLEVHKQGAFSPGDIEEVRVTPEDQAIEERILQRLRTGVVPRVEELLWTVRRLIAERRLARSSIRTRVVASAGRGSRWD